MSNGVFFLIQLLPLLVFIIVDGLFSNTVYSIISAIAVAVVYMVYTFLKTGNTDYMILIDVALITVLGVISIVVKNDIFFKLKPAIIDAIAILFLIGLSFASDNFILSYFGRFLPNNSMLTPEFIPFLKKMFIFFSFYIVLHIAAVWYTAIYSSRKVWAIVSGPGIFFLFIPVMIWVLFKRVMLKRKLAEARENI